MLEADLEPGAGVGGLGERAARGGRERVRGDVEPRQGLCEGQAEGEDGCENTGEGVGNDG